MGREVNLVRPRDRSHEGPEREKEKVPHWRCVVGRVREAVRERCGDAPHKEARRCSHQVNSILAFELSIVSSSRSQFQQVQNFRLNPGKTNR